MNFSAAALRLMAEKGLTLLDVAEIVAANDVRADPTANERQKRCRANKKANGHTVTVTRDTPPNESIILNPPETPMISDEITPPIAEIEIEKVEPEHVVEAWNAMAETCGLPKAKLTANRRPKLRTFVKRNSVDDITEAIWKIPHSDFLCGRNDRAWKADLDFLLNPSKFPKILEGSYG